jgi:excisionase family DNA binding protein
MNTVGARDAFGEAIAAAVETGLRKVLNLSEVTNRRVFSVEEAATYIRLSRREVYNMIATKQLRTVKHGKRTLLDIRDLDEWVELKKA